MRTITLLWTGILLSACSQEDCVQIEDKREINGSYYFFFGRGDRYTNNGNEMTLYVPDSQQSGKVDLDTYNTYQVGDNYCY
ncbi:MAG: hypothetical protein ACPHL7_04935 [Flavobacteriaceae bacterium]